MKNKPHKTPEEKLWPKIDKRGENECWPWLGGKLPKGYGCTNVRVNGKPKSAYAHREILRLVKGEPATPDMQALHSCDNPSCCNPKHLNWGTESQNRIQARNRLNNQGNQKLTLKQVEEIRIDPCAYKAIASKYGVHLDTISRIKTNRAWKA